MKIAYIIILSHGYAYTFIIHFCSPRCSKWGDTLTVCPPLEAVLEEVFIRSKIRSLNYQIVGDTTV